MANNFFIVQPPSEIATGTSARTVLQIKAPANCRVKVLGWGISFDGRDVAAEPIIVELLRQSDAGTMSLISPVKTRPVSDPLLTTAQHSATGEPTASDVLDVVEVHPQSGYDVRYPYGQEIVIPGGGYIGIRVTASSSVNCRVKIFGEE